jgi:hypothetical protein
MSVSPKACNVSVTAVRWAGKQNYPTCRVIQAAAVTLELWRWLAVFKLLTVERKTYKYIFS